MTAVDSTLPPMPSPAPSSSAPSAAPTDAAGALLRRVIDVLDRDGLAYCITHAYQQFPHRIESDVDCLMPREMLPRRVAELLKLNEHVIGARIVQWFEERAHFVVLQDRDGTMLQLHVSSDFEVNDRVIADGNELLRTRRSHRDGFWVPAAHIEFACVLANRIQKGSLLAEHMKQLSALWAANPLKCSEQLARMFRPQNVGIVGAAALRNEWGHVQSILKSLRWEMRWKLSAGQPLSVLCRFADSQRRRVKRWIAPHGGLHVVFLGPDGVGKSTVIEAVQERIRKVFLHTQYQTFARGILPNRVKPSPHALPPRGLPASLVKALWWLACYTAGYYKSVYPTLARGGLVINHRYLLDAIVDPRRYRYAGPMKLLNAIWRVSPKPHLVIFLDAPADIVHARKRETTLEETTRQREAYLALAKTLPNAHVVNTSQSPQQTIDEVTEILLKHMSAGVSRRMKLK